MQVQLLGSKGIGTEKMLSCGKMKAIIQIPTAEQSADSFRCQMSQFSKNEFTLRQAGHASKLKVSLGVPTVSAVSLA